MTRCRSYLHRITSTVSSLSLQCTCVFLKIHEDAYFAVSLDVVIPASGVRRNEQVHTASTEWTICCEVCTPKGIPRRVSPKGVVPCGWKRSSVAVATYHPSAGPRSHKPSVSELQGNTVYRVQFQYLLFTNARRNLLIS